VSTQAFTGAVPFSHSSPILAAEAIAKGQHPPKPTHQTFTEGVWALMQRCWDNDPCSRPEAHEVSKELLALSTSRALVRQLRLLDKSSPGFYDQLTAVLHGDEDQQRAPTLQGDDLVWLVDYLDKVCYHVGFPDPPHPRRRRLSMISISLIALSWGACANSERYVALGG